MSELTRERGGEGEEDAEDEEEGLLAAAAATALRVEGGRELAEGI